MEAPHVLHRHQRHPRSVPLPSAPPSDFPPYPNRYLPPHSPDNHIFSHLSQPQSLHLPPPPPPLPFYHPLDTPPPPRMSRYHSNQFTFSSYDHNNCLLTEGDPSGVVNFSGFREFTSHSPRIFYNDNWSHSRGQSRIDADSIPVMQHSPGDFERQLINRQFCYTPDSTYQPDRVRGLEGNSRFRVDHNDGLITNYWKEQGCWGDNENYNGRPQNASEFFTSFHDLSFVKDQMSLRNDIELSSGGFNDRSNSVCDSELVGSGRIDDSYEIKRQIARGVPNSLFQMENNTIGNNEGFRVAGGKRGHHVSEVGWCNSANRGGGESSHQFNDTPRKQVQKKSAFLRLQIAKRNRSDIEDKLDYSDKFEKKSFSFFTGKDQNGYRGVKMEKVEEIGGSHVELDISFKSNSLVAKAVVPTSASSPVTESNAIPTRSYKKVKNLCTSDLYLAGSKPSKLARRTMDINDSHRVNNFTSSDMNTKKSAQKVSATAACNRLKHNSKISSVIKNGLGENVKAAGYMDINDSHRVNNFTSSDMNTKKSAQKVSATAACNRLKHNSKISSGIKNGLGENVKAAGSMVSNKEITAVGCPKRHSSVSIKKKKNVRKLVKAINPCVCAENSHSTSKQNKIVNPADIPLVAFDSDLSVEPSRGQIISSGIAVKPNVGLNSCLDSSNILLEDIVVCDAPVAMESEKCKTDANFDEGHVPIIQVKDNMSDAFLGSSRFGEIIDIDLPVIEDNSVDILNTETVTLDSDSTRVQRFLGHEKKGSLLCGNKIGDESQDPISVSEENLKFDLENCGEIKADKCNEKNKVPYSGTIDGINKQLYSNQEAKILRDDDTQEMTAAKFLVGNSGLVCLLSSDEIRVHNNSIAANYSNNNQGSCCHNSGTNFLENGVINYPGTEYAVEEISPNHFALSSDNVVVKISPVHTIPFAGSKETDNKKGLVSTHSNFSCSGNLDVDPADSKTLSLSLKDSSQISVSRVGNMACGKEPDTQGVSIMHKKSLSDKLCETKNEVSHAMDNSASERSPRCRKKRKVSISSPYLPLPWDNEGSTNILTGCPDVHLSSNTEPTKQEVKVVASTIDDLYEGSSMPCRDDGSLDLNLDFSMELFGTVVHCSDPLSGFNDLKLRSSGVVSHPVLDNLINPLVHSTGSLTFGNGQRANATKVSEVINQNQTNFMETEIGSKEKIAHVTDGRGVIYAKSALRESPDEYQSPPSGQEVTIMNEESDNLPGKDDLHHIANYLHLSSDGNEGSAVNSSEEVIGSVIDGLSNMASPETGSDATDKFMLNSEPSLEQAFLEKVVDYKNREEKSMVVSQPKKLAHSLRIPSSNVNCNSGNVKLPLVSQLSKSAFNDRKLVTAKSMINKKHLGHTISRGFSGQSTFMCGSSKKFASSIGSVKSRTWHRVDNSNSSSLLLPGNKPCSSAVPTLRQFSGSDGVHQNSYIRKGNSLVRKSSPVSGIPSGSHAVNLFTYQLNSSNAEELRNDVKSESLVGVTDSSINLGIKVTENPANKLGITPVLSSSDTLSSGGCAPSTLAEPLLNDSSDFIKLRTKEESASFKDLLKNSDKHENLVFPSMENRTDLSNEFLASSNLEQGAHAKCNLHQLISTSNPCDLNITDKVQPITSDGYYKRRKNQLIRAALDSSVSQTLMSHLSDKIFKSELEYTAKDIPCKSYTGRRLAKGMAKARRPGKSSLVWSLCGSMSSKYGSNNLNGHKMVPHLPWKRTYRSHIRNPATIPCSTLSTISKRLLLSRKRETLYTTSNNGFSLKKSKVLSVDGSSLKWSKSIDRRSKKANEDATIAVAAADRKKREQNGIARVIYRTDNNSGNSSHDEPSCSTAVKSGKNAKISYAPRRLVIGNDAYVRIGNGNQLVRDPKKRIRRLASEKVRWSLHTARKRLGRKLKYCQFFTRFGTCDKNDGKCPYIHDPSKIAVCTKFLNDACSDVNCKLTHKIIPERMPDCSYFLQGLCTNKSCAYRHVNVNQKAPTCEGFLRGYCANGDECREKHSYVCPVFEATGSCAESKCKLHHPKKRNVVKKRKRSGELKNDSGRYFGSKPNNSMEPEKLSMQSTKLSAEGELADYICLSVSDDESGEVGGDQILEDLDEVIRPFRLMK